MSSKFEGRRIIFETQNRPQEAPREEKENLRRRSNEKNREEGQQEHPRGAQDGSLAPKKLPRDPQEHLRGAQKAPKRPPRAPKRGPGEPQDALKTTFGSKTSSFQKIQLPLERGPDFRGSEGLNCPTCWLSFSVFGASNLSKIPQ